MLYCLSRLKQPSLQKAQEGARSCVMRTLKQGWIEAYLQWIEDVSESPREYQLWSAATVIAAATKRHCWVNRGDWNLFPNMYVILVGHTGLGKGRSINPAVGLLRESGCANVLSDKLTIQYILEKLSDRGQQVAQIQAQASTLSIGHDASCFISSPEIEDLILTSDTMAPLKELWECKDGPFEYGTRSRGLVKIAKPCPTLLGGCTPSQVAELFPTKTVGGGFVRRCNFVYEYEKSQNIPWPTPRNGNDLLRNSLVNDLRHIGQLHGQFRFEQKAQSLFTQYYNRTTVISDEFADEASLSYDTTKSYHALKMAMALSESRSDSLEISMLDMLMAISMVDKSGKNLNRVFRAVGDSEMATIMEKVLRFIEQRGKTGFVTRADMMGALWRDVGSTRNLDDILMSLEAGHVIKSEQRFNKTVFKSTHKPDPTNITQEEIMRVRQSLGMNGDDTDD